MADNIRHALTILFVLGMGYIAVQSSVNQDRMARAADRTARATESTAKAQWAQVYWLKRQTALFETPCCMCE